MTPSAWFGYRTGPKVLYYKVRWLIRFMLGKYINLKIIQRRTPIKMRDNPAWTWLTKQMLKQVTIPKRKWFHLSKGNIK